MIESTDKINAEVIAVFPDKVRIVVDNLENFRIAEETLQVGSYLKISDNDNAVLMAIIENFSIVVNDSQKRDYIIEAFPLGMIRDGKFTRGGDSLAIPPKSVQPASEDEIRKIYEETIKKEEIFSFSRLSTNLEIRIPVNGNKFFNKHIAIVGSTGSGKSHALSSVVQKAVSAKNGEFALNNSHVIIFDIHSEYQSAFPNANFIGIKNLILPYWLLNSEELEEFFLDTEANDHNQRYIFKDAIVSERRLHFKGSESEKSRIHYDSPLFFDINNVLLAAKAKNEEVVESDEVYKTGTKAGQVKTTNGPLYGRLTNFVNRLENKINDNRLDFLLGDESKKISFEETIKQLLGYQQGRESNVTIIDLSGVPFEVLSITVSLISRMIFEYGYFYKRLRNSKNPEEKINSDIPILLVYEEAHKYAPNSDLAKYRSSKKSIERIAKEGRKYGVTLLLASQRPSEISETIFSQCNNFIAMRLTNPVDQSFVKKLLPDTLGSMIDKMSSLKQGEALLVGEAIVLPSIVQIDRCSPEPSSNDIPYWELWQEKWKSMNIEELKKEWYR